MKPEHPQTVITPASESTPPLLGRPDPVTPHPGQQLLREQPFRTGHGQTESMRHHFDNSLLQCSRKVEILKGSRITVSIR